MKLGLARYSTRRLPLPALFWAVAGSLPLALSLAADVGRNSITPYGTLSGSTAALIAMSATTGGPTLLSTSAVLVPGKQYSIFLYDTVATPITTVMTVIDDQQTNAAVGQAAFRFLNQAPKAGALDIYMVPTGVALASAVPLVSDLAAGSATAYVGFPAQTVTLVITPAGATKPQYTSAPISLIGGEARTVLIMDSQLTSNPPVTATIADDAGPAN